MKPETPPAFSPAEVARGRALEPRIAAIAEEGAAIIRAGLGAWPDASAPADVVSHRAERRRPDKARYCGV